MGYKRSFICCGCGCCEHAKGVIQGLRELTDDSAEVRDVLLAALLAVMGAVDTDSPAYKIASKAMKADIDRELANQKGDQPST
jgi:hypothetical protein